MIIDSIKLKENLKSDYRRNLFNQRKWESLKQSPKLDYKEIKDMDTLNENTIDMFVEFIDKHNLHFSRNVGGRGTGNESTMDPEYNVFSDEEFIKTYGANKGHWWG
ncbi:hypothetical protein PQ744_10795 [Thermoanaerobacterium thermosaccharolyticum]|uniref:hypothetical protein n=1 Tax=Thermoanaerobacterium thermosaccharolyticum TaxID=1517 RepID=UPI003D268596